MPQRKTRKDPKTLRDERPERLGIFLSALQTVLALVRLLGDSLKWW